MLTVGGLCSGIGGLELGLERAGMRIVWHAETDPYAARVLAKHWPHVPNLGDITAIDWSTVERPDLVCAGFPCQPFSQAGARRGADDPRHLWPHVARCLRLLRPRWALLENVPGILTLGFGEVLADLAELGYCVEWESIPAAAVGAPHLRYRIFIVAHAHSRGLEECQEFDGEPQQDAADRYPCWEHADRLCDDVADADREQLRMRTGSVPTAPRAGESQEPERQRVRTHAGNGGQGVADTVGARCVGPRPTQERRTLDRGAIPIGESWWEPEPDVGRVADGVPARVDRLRCLGNAVVPQVAEWVGRQILEADKS